MLKQYIYNRKGGFTLIEVVLVLAIGALIITMAVVAFQGTQRSQRNTARTKLVQLIRGSVEQFAADNSNTYPTSAQFTSMVTTNAWKDPKSGAAAPTNGTIATAQTAVGVMYYQNANCTAANNTVAATAPAYAITYYQENGVLGCTDNTK